MLSFLPHPAPTPPRIVRPERTFTDIFAIGDIHGCLDELEALEQRIAEHVGDRAADTLVVYLGDYVDRGPKSAGVIDHCLAPPLLPWTRVHLAGNHEDMMLDFLTRPRPEHPWLQNGGRETLRSYGLDPATIFTGASWLVTQRLADHISTRHAQFLTALPNCVSLAEHTFVHAGLRPGLPLDRQTRADMIWLRLPAGALAAAQPFGTLIHGHTPAATPIIEPNRICVDTGAFATGVLSAVHLTANGGVSLISTAPSDRLP